MNEIRIRGAKTHNLKSVDLDIPRDKLVVITGLSGSGKSSLAFDTLYAEGQRRYVESLSAYARQFLSVMEKPDVELIEGLSPAISIEQKTTSHNPRSTVGTVTEIYDYLRLLFARVGTAKCPEHDVPLVAQTVPQIVESIRNLTEGTKIMVLAPVVSNRKGEHKDKLAQLRAEGYVRIRLDGTVVLLEDKPKIDPKKKHTIEVVVDRLKVSKEKNNRLADSIETALNLADNVVCVFNMDDETEQLYSAKHACTECGFSLPELEPRLFSFNSPVGACEQCDGLGVHQYFDEERIVVQPSVPLGAGAIRGWDKRSPYYFQMLNALADHFGFDIEKPFNKLGKKIQDIILRGTDELIKFSFESDRGYVSERVSEFEGVIPNMERRYRDTDSDQMREELSKFISRQSCPECKGSRLCLPARSVFVGKKNIADITRLSISEAIAYFNKIVFKGARAPIADKILKEIVSRLTFLENVGLEYLTMSRTADTLSGGEAQRIRLASQIGAGLVGVMYVLDEPSIGLHQRDNSRLIKTLEHLKSLGNCVIVVEHDEEAIRAADHVIDIGPGAGVHGGEVIAQGTPDDVAKSNGLTGDYLSGKKSIAVPKERLAFDKSKVISIKGASGNNLKNVNVDIPIGIFTCVTGVSGSGKSTLINHTLSPVAQHLLNRADLHWHEPYKSIAGLEHLDKVVIIDQSPIGRTPRSNAATYTGLFTVIRDLFAQTEDARARGYKSGRFSFNVRGGRCEACQGDGLIRVEMHFLADVYVTCDECQGKRYNEQTLEIKYKGKTIADVLDMTAEDGLEFFDAIPSIARKCQTLCDVGLSYLKIGQSATTLSGGEAQRIKLSRELSKRDTGKTLYVLDEPTTGLHFHDVAQLLHVLEKLKGRGNTILVIEHNLDVVKTADYVIDLGPEGGSGGGTIVATGTPEEVAKVAASHTGKFLKELLK